MSNDKQSRWSQTEIDYLTEHKDDPIKKVAKHLGRTTSAVGFKKKELGLTKKRKNSTGSTKGLVAFSKTTTRRKPRVRMQKKETPKEFIIVSESGARSKVLSEEKLHEMVNSSKITYGATVYEVTPRFKVARVTKPELASV